MNDLVKYECVEGRVPECQEDPVNSWMTAEQFYAGLGIVQVCTSSVFRAKDDCRVVLCRCCASKHTFPALGIRTGSQAVLHWFKQRRVTSRLSGSRRPWGRSCFCACCPYLY
eukprot:1150168-Pelagomonas_calceolata.AAC.6